MSINENTITIMGYTITIDDIIDNLYYRYNIGLTMTFPDGYKDPLLLYNNIDSNDLNIFIKNKIVPAAKIAHYNKPLFKLLNVSNKDDNKILPPYIITNNIIKSGFPTYFDSKKNEINYLNNYFTDEILKDKPLNETLKFKIKEERLTRNLRIEINNNIKQQDGINRFLRNDLKDIRNTIKEQEEIFIIELKQLIKEQDEENIKLKNKYIKSFKDQEIINSNLKKNLEEQERKIKYNSCNITIVFIINISLLCLFLFKDFKDH
jgi:hypothetical protein